MKDEKDNGEDGMKMVRPGKIRGQVGRRKKVLSSTHVHRDWHNKDASLRKEMIKYLGLCKSQYF